MPSNLWCRLDPKCKKHPWHGGHMGPIPPSNPQVIYEARTRRKDAGRRAWSMVKKWERLWCERPLLESERHMLFIFIRDELMMTNLMPIGKK